MSKNPQEDLKAIDRRQLEALRDAFALQWQKGEMPRLEDCLQSLPEPHAATAFAELLAVEIACRRARDLDVSADEYFARFPNFSTEIEGQFSDLTQQIATGELPTELFGQGSTQHAGNKKHGGEPRLSGIGKIGEYDLYQEIARGGMGVVYKARHRVLDRLVAIKIPRAAQLEDEGEARFLREAKAAAQLRHPNICPIYEVGNTGKQPFIALGFVDGPTLRQRMADKISPRDVAEIMAKVARAVDYAHERGVIHRDIKPSNIMLDEDSGEPVLMDFGLAKQLSEGDSHVTKSGQVMGTPVYMAPEQAAGEHDRIGSRTDVYSLGAVLYELLTGQAPFQGPTGDVIRRVQTDEPTAPRKLAPNLHRDLETICLKAMSKLPEARYESAASLADDLERFAAGDAILARREGITRRSLRFLRRHSQMASILLVVAVLTGSIASYFAWSASEVNQVVSASQQFQERLQVDDLTISDWEELESLAVQLQTLDAAAGESARQQLHQKVSNGIRDRIASSAVLNERDFTQLDEEISWLETRDADAATRLSRQLQARRRAWQDLFALAAPYDNYSDIFPGEFEISDGGVLRRPQSTDDNVRRLTKISSLGSVRLRAKFSVEFKGTGEIGLLLHADNKSGYEFLLRVPQLPSRSTRKVPADQVLFWHQMEVAGNVEMQILRDGLLLRQVTVPANSIFDNETGELTIVATADADRLSFQVGDEPALIFDDIFPTLGGGDLRFGVVWPANTKLVELTAMRKPLPVVPSPLEQGDQLFAQQKWDAALTQYRQQASLGKDDEVVEQAKYKQALCLVQLNQQDEAVTVLQSLAESQNERLRILASCRLWLLHLQKSQYDEAAVVFESIKSQYEFQQLALLVPQAERQSIIRQTYNATTGLNLFRFGEDDLQVLEQASNIQNLLDPTPNSNDRGMRTWQLLRGFHVTGKVDRGIQLVQQYRSQRVRLDENMAIGILSEGGWLLRQRGETRQALDMINKHMGNRETADRWQTQLLIERARIRAAQQEWDKAANDLDFFLDSEYCTANYREFSAACLMRGLLHERDGDVELAQEVWHRGLHQNWLREAGQRRPVGPSLTGMQSAFALLISAKCGDRSEGEIRELIAGSFPISNAGATAQLAKQYSHVLAPAIANMGKSQRGQEVIWRIAFLEDSLQQTLREPANLIFLEMTRIGAAPGDWTPEEEQIVWDMMNAGFDLYMAERVGMPQAVQIMLTWKGANNIFGWKGVASSIDPSMRGPAAYVFGHRFLKLNKREDAREFFQTALKDAPQDSLLRQLAEAKLAELHDAANASGN